MNYLLDTDTCSFHLRGDQRLFHRFIQYSGRLHVSRITIAELLVWVNRASPAKRQSREEYVEKLIRDTTIVEVDERVCRKYGRIQSAKLARGNIGPRFDMVIAACALVHDLAVVTGNERDFADIDGLTVVNWLV